MNLFMYLTLGASVLVIACVAWWWVSDMLAERRRSKQKRLAYHCYTSPFLAHWAQGEHRPNVRR